MAVAAPRKVIFVGGTPYSGTTFFHMVLANDPHALAVGELRLLFNPLEPHHVNRACGCGDPDCELWGKLQRLEESHAFEAIFQLEPDVRCIVDSSKSVFWIARQSEALARAGIPSRHLLIWKSPEELYCSLERRGRGQDWEAVWSNYHLLYFSMIKEWRAVPYAEFVNDPSVLQAACEWSGLPYFSGKEEYWQRAHHIFGGNRTARFHLYADAGARRELQDTFDENRMRFHRKIYYSTPSAADLRLRQGLSRHKLERMDAILDTLLKHDVRSKRADASLPTMPRPLVLARRVKYSLEHAYGRWKFRSARQPT